MKTVTFDEARRQKAGGAAALYMALALLAAMPFFLLAVDYLGADTAEKKVALIVANYGSMYAMYLVSYVFYGIALGAVAFALYDRLRDSAPATMRMATAVGLLWAFALVASGMIFNYGMAAVAALDKADPARARDAWLGIEAVAQALGGAGGELLGGLWIFIVSAVALRSGTLPKPLGWFGAAVGTAGLLSIVPPLRDAALAFGLMLIVWFAWLGLTLARTKPSSDATGPQGGAVTG